MVASVASAHADEVVGLRRLPRGHVEVSAVQQLSLSSGTVGSPWSLAVDAAYGITETFTLGVSHSAQALGWVRGGGGLCIESQAHPCDALYAGGYLDGRLALPGSDWVTLLARVGVDIAGSDPVKPVLRLGATMRWRRGRAWLATQPEVAIALAERNNGNSNGLIAPAWIGLDTRRVTLWFETGFDGDIDGFVDEVKIRAAVGASVDWGRWRAGVGAGFPQLFGPQNSGRIRHGAVWLTWRH